MARRSAAAASVVLVAALVAAGCGASGATPSTAASTALPTASAAVPSTPAGKTSAAPALLCFTARTTDGTTFDGRRLAGKPAVLWFWAPWCPTCRAQAAGVTTLAGGYAGQVNVVGVGGLDDSAAISEFADAVNSFPQLDDPRGEIWKRFGITAQSTYVLLDASGSVRFRGYLDDAELARRVAELAG